MPTQLYQNQIAKGLTSTDLPATFDLFASDRQPITDQAQAGGADIAQFTVCGRITATQRIVPWAPAANDGSQKAICVTAQPIKANDMGPIYTAADFNHEALIWPAGAAADTLAERKMAFDGTPIGVRQLI